MKIPKSLFVIAICLLFVGQAYATATFDASEDITIGFSQIWNNLDIETLALSTSSTGFTSSSASATANENPTDLSIEVFASVSGSAGDAIGSVSGTVQAIATKEVIANFNFPSTTLFTITILDHNASAATNITLPQESASALASFDVLLDNSTDITDQLLLSSNGSVQFDLSGGLHFVILTAHAEGSADSPATVPEPSTMLLLGSGLIGLEGYGRKRLFRK